MAKIFRPAVQELATTVKLFPESESVELKIKDATFTPGVGSRNDPTKTNYWGRLGFVFVCDNPEIEELMERKEPSIRHQLFLNFDEETEALSYSGNPAFACLLREFELNTPEASADFELGIDEAELEQDEFPQRAYNKKFFDNACMMLKGRRISAKIAHRPRQDNSKLSEAYIANFIYTKE